MKFQLKLLGALVALSCGAAQAGVIQVGGQAAGADGKISAQAGVCTVNFNGGNAANTCGAVYTQGNNAPVSSTHFRTGNTSSAAAPAGDTTVFFTVGPTDGTQVNIALATNANYFGFYAGSLDSFNLVQFYLGNVLVDSFTGTQINAVAFPNQPTSGNQSQAQYIDYFLTANSFYNRIVYSSSADAFETDNHAFGLATPRGVPEPGTTALLGFGALALLARRRRQA